MRQLPQSRITRKPTGKRITLRPRDMLMLEFIQRHGPLPSHYLYEATKHISRNMFWHRKRLKDLWNERDTPHGSFYLERPFQQFQTYFARSQFIVYGLTDASRQALADAGKLNQYATPPGGGFTHALMTSCVTASIELECAKAGHRYISQEEILARAPVSTRTAKQPLAMPSEISHTFKKEGSTYTHTSNRPTVPDQLFGIDYGGKASFFALEIDRATEPVFRFNLTQNSYLRKVLCYRAINRSRAYEKMFGIPNLIILNVTTSAAHRDSILELVKELTMKPDRSYGISNLVFQTVTDFAQFLKVPPVLAHLWSEPWLRAGKEPFFINGS
jgi:hypothetical protein